MTKNTKIIIGVISGAVLMGGLVVITALIGIIYFAARADAGNASSKRAEKPAAVKEAKLYKQADVDNLIKFHEWASEMKFSAERRHKFESFLDRDFRRDAAKARKDTDELLATYDKIRAEEKSVRDFTRVLIVAAYVEDFRKKSDDDYSRFMLAVYEKRDDDTPDISNDATDVSAKKVSLSEGSMSPELIGKWQRSEGSGYIDPTGKTQYKSGTYYTYEFGSDGTIEFSMDSDVLSILQCKIAETKRATGTATVSGDSMTISFGKMAHTYSDSCKSSDDVNETLSAETVTLNWRLKTEYDVTRLCIDEKDGERCYDKIEK